MNGFFTWAGWPEGAECGEPPWDIHEWYGDVHNFGQGGAGLASPILDDARSGVHLGHELEFKLDPCLAGGGSGAPSCTFATGSPEQLQCEGKRPLKPAVRYPSGYEVQCSIEQVSERARLRNSLAGSGLVTYQQVKDRAFDALHGAMMRRRIERGNIRAELSAGSVPSLVADSFSSAAGAADVASSVALTAEAADAMDAADAQHNSDPVIRHGDHWWAIRNDESELVVADCSARGTAAHSLAGFISQLPAIDQPAYPVVQGGALSFRRSPTDAHLAGSYFVDAVQQVSSTAAQKKAPTSKITFGAISANVLTLCEDQSEATTLPAADLCAIQVSRSALLRRQLAACQIIFAGIQ